MVEASLAINPFDAMVYVTLLIAGCISAYRGFVSEFLSLLTWFGAGLITLAMADKSIGFAQQFIDSNVGAAAVGVLGTYFIAVILLGLFTHGFLRYVRKGSDVGYLDNGLGLLFGFVKGGLIIVLGFLLLTFIFREDGMPDWVRNASTLPTVKKAALAVVNMMPEYLDGMSSLSMEEEINNVPERRDDFLLPDQFSDPADIDSYINEHINQDKAGENVRALEQLIEDVTRDREDQGAF
ncbi:MAG: CvpA family protein [Sphaerospermopsis sp. SIO1G2]|nr:CvpA family protein [Sphaerospermopsis sp. SIO1G2]